jgi:outer membrane protein, heavy metal efflux system
MKASNLFVTSSRRRSAILARFCALVAALALLQVPRESRAQERALTRPRIAALVKQAPAVKVARSEVEVSSAQVAAAGVLSLDNPVLSGLGGVRFAADGRRPFNAVASVSWPVDLGGQRGARQGAADAELVTARAVERETNQRVLLAALLQHTLVLRDQRAVTLAEARHKLSERVRVAAEQRYSAGSVPELDVALAGMQEKRDASIEAAAIGDRDADRAALLAALGLTEDAPVEGGLVPSGELPALAALAARIEERPDVRTASSALRASEARAERERSAGAPTLSLLAQYERDDRDNIGLIGVALPIPILNANRAGVATSTAEVGVAQAKLSQARAGAHGRLRELYTRYRATQAAMDSLSPTAALAAKAVNLATRGYELGESDLASVLLVRREALESEAALLDAEYAHATVKVELLVLAGQVPQ